MVQNRYCNVIKNPERNLRVLFCPYIWIDYRITPLSNKLSISAISSEVAFVKPVI